MSLNPEEKAWQRFPGGIAVEPAGRGAVYRWRVLPDRPGLIIFFSILGLFILSLGLLGLLLIFGAVCDWAGILENQFEDYGGMIIIGIPLAVVFFKILPFFATILFARCRLALSPTELDYQVFLFGRRVRPKSFHLPAGEVVNLVLKDVSTKGMEVQRRQGKPFYLLLQRYSEGDLMKIKKRFLQDLGCDMSIGGKSV